MKSVPTIVVLWSLGAIWAQGDALDEWTYRSSGVGSANFSSAAYGGGKFVAGGSSSPGTILMSSEDGVVWTPRLQGGVPQIADITYGDGKFVGAGSAGTVVVSPNGENWSSLTVSNTGAVMLYGITYGNGLYVMVGDYNAGDFTFHATIYRSPDGFTWSNWTSTAASNLRDVAYGNGRFVALGNGFNRSPDPDRRVLVSANGADWTPWDAAGYTDLRAVTYGNGQFVAVARQGATTAMLTSPNGESWTPHPLLLTNYFISRIGFGNGTYVAVGSLNQSQHILLHSTNGASWEVTKIGPQMGNYFLYDVTFGEGTFVVVGQPNTIAQSASVTVPSFERIVRASSTQTQLDISGEVGRAYRLQYSTDLFQWHPLLTYTNGLPTTRVTDTSALGAPRFYRAVTP